MTMICPACGTKYNNDSEEEGDELCHACKEKTQKTITIECTVNCGTFGMTKMDGVLIMDYIEKLMLGRGFNVIDMRFLETYQWREIPMKEDIARLQKEGLLQK